MWVTAQVVFAGSDRAHTLRRLLRPIAWSQSGRRGSGRCCNDRPLRCFVVPSRRPRRRSSGRRRAHSRLPRSRTGGCRARRWEGAVVGDSVAPGCRWDRGSTFGSSDAVDVVVAADDTVSPEALRCSLIKSQSSGTRSGSQGRSGRSARTRWSDRHRRLRGLACGAGSARSLLLGGVGLTTDPSATRSPPWLTSFCPLLA